MLKAIGVPIISFIGIVQLSSSWKKMCLLCRTLHTVCSIEHRDDIMFCVYAHISWDDNILYGLTNISFSDSILKFYTFTRVISLTGDRYAPGSCKSNDQTNQITNNLLGICNKKTKLKHCTCLCVQIQKLNNLEVFVSKKPKLPRWPKVGLWSLSLKICLHYEWPLQYMAWWIL